MAKVDLSPVHPGEILREEFLKPLGIKQKELAKAIGLPPSVICTIVKEQRSISVEMARGFAKFFGTSVDLWFNLQQSYDLKVSRAKYPDLESKITPWIKCLELRKLRAEDAVKKHGQKTRSERRK